MSTPIKLKANYTNPTIQLLYNTTITEYDMVDAGFSIIKKFGLLPQEKIDFLTRLTKKERNIAIGKLRGTDYTLSRSMAVNLRNIMAEFITINNIDDDHIISIKNDAVFVFESSVNSLDISGMKFSAKNVYTSYTYLNRVEFYYSEKNMDIKGFGPDLIKHQGKFMVEYFRRMLRMKESLSTDTILRECNIFNGKYLGRKLPLEYYYELTSLGGYKLISSLTTQDVFLDQVTADMLHDIDISYNYLNFILPLTKMLIQ